MKRLSPRLLLALALTSGIAFASIACWMLMLSDKSEVDQDAKNLTGIRRSSPVLFSVPGRSSTPIPARPTS